MPSKSKKANTAQPNPAPPLPTTTPSQTSLPSANGTKTNAQVNGAQLRPPSTAPPDSASADMVNTTPGGEENNSTSVNRKKQKRREKEAAKRAAEQHLNNGLSHANYLAQNGHSSLPSHSRGPPKGYFTEEADDYIDPEFADEPVEVDDAFFSGAEDAAYAHSQYVQNGYQHSMGGGGGGTGGKKKKKKTGGVQGNIHNHAAGSSSSLAGVPAPLHRSHLPPPPLSNAALRSAHKISRDQIWNTSTQAERENIKQFWLELGEEERRSLVKVEKEAVLRKMKEQQKHSCSCTVCGRKRTAIEEELEVLYDAYYEELEQFANHNHDLVNGLPQMPPPRSYHQIQSPPPQMAGAYPSRDRIHEIGDEDDDLDDEQEYDEEEEAYSDDELGDHPPGPPDFFTFGNSLTVKDGILTVADDLLKNDGKHFIDMMEQLAERRMQREEDIHYPSTALAHQSSHQGHNHPPIDEDDDFDDEEDDEEYDSQDEDDYDRDEMDTMTEEQRMEEGRRMFQIFAARMFEQRVLTAYREKVAQERQAKLIEELDEENRLDSQREAKKAKEAAKKKEKKKLQKQAKEEEKAKRDAEKAAQEAAAREVEEKKLEEQRQRKEEQRKKREAEKKAVEEEQARKEAEKLRKAQEARDRQAETERKAREAKEREKKKREDAQKKAREEREAKDREAKERKEKAEQERKAKEDQARKDKDAVEKDVRDRAGATKRPSVAVPPGLHPPAYSTNFYSPQMQIATPIIPPKIPTPASRTRQTSQQGQQSRGSSPRSQHATTTASHSSASPASSAIPQTPVSLNAPLRPQGQPPVLHHPQPNAPLSPLNNQGRAGQAPFSHPNISGLGMTGPPQSGPGVLPGMMPPMPMYQGPPMGGPQRNFGPSNSVQYPPPGIGNRQFPQSQQMPFQSQAPTQPSISAPQAQPAQVVKTQPHSRQPSGSNTDSLIQPTPIGRPGPIGRPPSTTPDRQKRKPSDDDVDNLATQLGSKALLDDSDVPLNANTESMLIPSAPGGPNFNRGPFSNFGESRHDSFGLGSPNLNAFGSNMAGSANWGAPPPNRQSGAWPSSTQPSNNAFGSLSGGLGSMSRPQPRAVATRLRLAAACQQLASAPGSQDRFQPVGAVLQRVNQQKGSNEPAISMEEMLDICDTEGNAQNGGGSFEIRNDRFKMGDAMSNNPFPMIKFEPDSVAGGRGLVGDIGSPFMGHSQPAPFGSAVGQPGRGF